MKKIKINTHTHSRIQTHTHTSLFVKNDGVVTQPHLIGPDGGEVGDRRITTQVMTIDEDMAMRDHARVGTERTDLDAKG